MKQIFVQIMQKIAVCLNFLLFLLYISDAGGLTCHKPVKTFIRRLSYICNTSRAVTWLLHLQEKGAY